MCRATLSVAVIALLAVLIGCAESPDELVERLNTRDRQEMQVVADRLLRHQRDIVPALRRGLQTDNWVFLHPGSVLAPREEELFGKRPGIPPPPGMRLRNFGDPNALRDKLYTLVAGPRRRGRRR